MPKCKFSIPFSGDPETLIERANDAISAAKGNFSGDTGAGFFRLSTPIGRVSGTYNISESAIHIEIDDKPVFVGCGKIESELQKYLNG
jgi:hypothetical protein